jgi:isopenicillin N synthase-like dioxygenase
MQPNIFPPPHILPGFQPFITSYFSHCTTLVNNLLHVLSYALNLPAPGLAPTHASAMFHLRLLHYPEIAAKELSGGCGKGLKRSRINAHSDFGSLTLLFQDSIGGLEVQDPSNDRFRPAPPIRDTVLVNIGDLMARWSNGRWASTVHRVGVPDDVAYTKLGSKEQNGDKGETIVPSRYSIPFFAVPDADTVIEALDGCWDEDTRPKIYEPVTAGAYVQMRLAALYNK